MSLENSNLNSNSSNTSDTFTTSNTSNTSNTSDTSNTFTTSDTFTTSNSSNNMNTTSDTSNTPDTSNFDIEFNKEMASIINQITSVKISDTNNNETNELFKEEWFREIIKNALMYNPKLFFTLPKDLQQNKELVLLAVSNDGNIIADLENHYKNDIDVNLAIVQRLFGLEHSPLLNNIDFMNMAIDINPKAREYADESIKTLIKK